MRKLYYNVYNNISDEDFIPLGNLLIPIEKQLYEKVKNAGWQLHTPIAKRDSLVIDFVKEDAGFYGNFGIETVDTSNPHLFNFYITKSFDDDCARYFLKRYVFQSKEMEYFKDNVREYLNQALTWYNSVTKDVILNQGEKFSFSGGIE